MGADAATVTVLSQPAGGSVTLSSDGKIVFTPTGVPTGTYTFTYRVNCSSTVRWREGTGCITRRVFLIKPLVHVQAACSGTKQRCDALAAPLTDLHRLYLPLLCRRLNRPRMVPSPWLHLVSHCFPGGSGGGGHARVVRCFSPSPTHSCELLPARLASSPVRR